MQAEIGRAKLTPAHSIPSRGHMMCDFTLPLIEGKPISLFDYRGRANLVVFFAGDPDHTEGQRLLSSLAEHYAEIRDQDSEVLLVLACSRERAGWVKAQSQLPFPVVVDENAQVHKEVGAFRGQAGFAPALYVMDRFMEVHAAWHTGFGGTLPGVPDVLSWLAYLDSVCPECTQVEWPNEE